MIEDNNRNPDRIRSTELGVLSVAFGGTRVAIKTDRPWQSPILVDPESCPFEQPSDLISVPGLPHRWRVLPNRFTPFHYHVLLVPDVCWPESELRSLGGPDAIRHALTAVDLIARDAPQEIWVGVHIGALAGQNLAHLHYHIIAPFPHASKPSVGGTLGDIFPTLDMIDGWEIRVAGHRSGQVLFIPHDREQLVAAFTLTNSFTHVLDLFNATFSARDGRSPDFMMGVKMVNRSCEYAYYAPILYNWGFTEHFALLEGTPLVMPWSFESTVAALKAHCNRPG